MLFNEIKENKLGLFGKKGFSFIEMHKLGIPIPNGFILTTKLCKEIIEEKCLNISILDEIKNKIKGLEKLTGKKYGDDRNPLLLSLIISSPYDIPDLPNDVFSIGINAKISGIKGNPKLRYIFERYLEFVKQVGMNILNIPQDDFYNLIERYDIQENNADSKLCEIFINLIQDFESIIEIQNKQEFLYDPYKQLEFIIKYFLFNIKTNWVEKYCDKKQVDINSSFAIIIQETISGNKDMESGYGIVTTRNIINGKKQIQGIFIPHTYTLEHPKEISYIYEKYPLIYIALIHICSNLEHHFRCPLLITFNIEKNHLTIENAQKFSYSQKSIIKIVVKLVEENICNEEEAMLLLPDKLIKTLSNIKINSGNDDSYSSKYGISIDTGIVSGRIIFSDEDFTKFKSDLIILVKKRLKLQDLSTIRRVDGVLTIKSGPTSHIIIIAKSLGKCCLIGSNNIDIDEQNHKLKIGDTILKSGDWITLDGDNGNIFIGKIRSDLTKPIPEVKTICSWADRIRRIKIFSNCDNLESVIMANYFGADGIGLLRTENLLLKKENLNLLLPLILNFDKNQKNIELQKILKILEEELLKIFCEINGKMIIIRTFDFPLHRILVNSESEIVKLVNRFNLDKESLKRRLKSLEFSNPMLGIRGCRLGIFFPEIIRIQAKAIFNAIVKALELNIRVNSTILLPFIMDIEEVKFYKKIFREIADEILNTKQQQFNYKIGVMIEQPRAALICDKISQLVDIIAFGTNDLTQLIFALDRDDANYLINFYLTNKIFEYNPYEVLDINSLGKLIKNAAFDARKTNDNITIGICGEHTNFIENHEFFINENFDYLSCTPSKIIPARLSTAKKTVQKSKAYMNILHKNLSKNQNFMWTAFCLENLKKRISIGKYEEAKEIAFNWVKLISNRHEFQYSPIWKYNKRNMVIKWFGKYEYRRFLPGWQLNEIFEYTNKFVNKTMRISLFPKDIACHAISYRLDKDNRKLWRNILSKIDNTIPIEVFPEASPEFMCFRAFKSFSNFYIEASIGQAMYVFEVEQGKHPIIFAKLEQGKFKYTKRNVDQLNKEKTIEIERRFRIFIENHGKLLNLRSELILLALGVEFTSLEGYYDIKQPKKFLIVDIDLPFDIAFI